MNKILITGATGQVGSSIAKKLLEQGKDLRVLVRSGSMHPFIDNKEIELVNGDLLDIDSVNKAVKGCSYIYHVGGLISYKKVDKNNLYKVNVEGTKNILDAAKKYNIIKVVHTSSTAAVGLSFSESDILDENAKFLEEFEKIPYMNTKHLAELEVMKAHKNGLNVVIVNPSTIFGEGDEKMNTGNLFRNILKGKVGISTPGGNSIVTLGSVVNGHLLAMENGVSGERYILSSLNLKMIDLINKIAETIKVKNVKKEIPKFFEKLIKETSTILEIFNKNATLTPQIVYFSFNYRYFCSQKAQKKLGWIPDKEMDFLNHLNDAHKYYIDRNLY